MALGTLTLTVTARDHDVLIEVECDGMTTVTVYRQDPGGSRIVRGMELSDDITPPGRFVGVDPEVPNAFLGYFCLVADATEAIYSETKYVEVDHGGDWFMPLGMATRGRLVNVESLRSHTYTADREVVAVLGRRDPIAVHFGRHWFSGALVLITLEPEDRDWLRETLYDARIIVFCPRADAGYPLPLYLSVGDVSEERVSSLAVEQSRRWTLDIQSIASPPAKYEVAPIGDSWSVVEARGDSWALVKVTDTWKSLMGLS